MNYFIRLYCANANAIRASLSALSELDYWNESCSQTKVVLTETLRATE